MIEEVCGFAPAVQGSQVRTGLGADVLVAWEHYAGFPSGARDIRLRRSADGGASFGAPSIVSPVKAVGDGFVLQGNFRAFIDLQSLAVDTSGGPNTGAVYVSWHDGRNASRPDVFGICPSFTPSGFCAAPRVYQFGDILLARSNDGGATFSLPVRVNDDPITLAVDQFMPAMIVDNQGTLFLAFFDRRADPRNFLIDTFLARSSDGVKFKNTRLTDQSFATITGWQDILVNPFYMGDYISVAVDATRANDGVIAAWGDNALGDANVSFSKR